MRLLLLTILAINTLGLSAQNFSYKKTTEGVQISENNKPVLFYQTKPKTVAGQYERMGYVHPLYDLAGNVITEDGPADHLYHRGIFTAWHQVIIDGKRVANSWISEKVAFEPGKMQVTKSSKNLILTSAVIWKLTDSSNKKNIINEIDRINIFSAKEHYRIIDFNIIIKPLVPNMQLGGADDYKGYGGFCLRLKLPENVKFVSGKDEITPTDPPVTAGPWMDFQLDGKGVAVFGYRDEPASEYKWIVRKEKSMQNVPFPGRKAKDLPEEGWNLFYRVVIHDNTITSDDIQRLYDEYKSSNIKQANQ
jgi:hypothetical protein